MVRMSILHSKAQPPCDKKYKRKIQIDNNLFMMADKTLSNLTDITMNDMSSEIFTKLSSNNNIALNHQSRLNLDDALLILTKMSMQNVVRHTCQSLYRMLRSTACSLSIHAAVHEGNDTDEASEYLNERVDLIEAVDRCLALARSHQLDAAKLFLESVTKTLSIGVSQGEITVKISTFATNLLTRYICKPTPPSNIILKPSKRITKTIHYKKAQTTTNELFPPTRQTSYLHPFTQCIPTSSNQNHQL